MLVVEDTPVYIGARRFRVGGTQPCERVVDAVGRIEGVMMASPLPLRTFLLILLVDNM